MVEEIIKTWKKTDVRCPNNCMVKDGEGRDIAEGFLEESPESTGFLFCKTSGCPFAFKDDKKIDHWVGGEAPINLVNNNPNGKN